MDSEKYMFRSVNLLYTILTVRKKTQYDVLDWCDQSVRVENMNVKT